ncbi:MAG: EamA family transporter [Bacteroidales bacterium]|jgi:drug/metabolite transporter (DMT)-like permease|nr:EamA family transporter [Bacteroidales bacterium]
MLSLTGIFLLTGLAGIGAAAQLCLKRGADQGRTERFLQALFRPYVFAGLFLTGVNMLALVWILRRLPLTSVIPMMALVYVLVPVGALFFFEEKLRPRFWTGALLIVTGIIITAV